MSLVINHNLMAMNSARNLSDHYGQLSVSTRRLSSGLRIGTAADDAAGLAIRELMRADIATLNQGVRNANDAISMIQTADGALQVIDEKLIRMKELSEQASTGTYNSDQRLIIHSEFVEMREEIYRISNSTEFNGIKLLNGSLSSAHDGSGVQSTGAVKIHFGTGNDCAEDYYNISIPRLNDAMVNLGGSIDYSGQTYGQDWWIYHDNGGGSASHQINVVNQYAITSNAQEFEVYYRLSQPVMTDDGVNHPVVLRSPDASQLVNFDGIEVHFDRTALNWSIVNKGNASDPYYNATISTLPSHGFRIYLEGNGGSPFVEGLFNFGLPSTDTNVRFNTSSGWGIVDNNNSYNNASISGATRGELSYDLDLNGDGSVDIEGQFDGFNLPNIRHAFATFSMESNYRVDPGVLKLERCDLRTQENSQEALEYINAAIIYKDKIRANLGAMQNRLENTISNLQIQAENLQAAESRISDTDVSQEMTEFVREQILTQAATAMLAQANSLPKMALQIISGT